MGTDLTIKAPRGLARSFDPDTLMAEWRAEMQARADAGELSDSTATTYYRGMAKFWAWFRGQGTYASVGPRAIRSWIADMRRDGRKPAGVNVLYAGVRAFFRWAVAERGLAYNPTLTTGGAKRTSRRHKRDPLSDAEVLRVLAQPDTSTDAGKRAKAMLCLMAYTGARTIEVQRAKVGDLRSNGQLKLYVQGKGHVGEDVLFRFCYHFGGLGPAGPHSPHHLCQLLSSGPATRLSEHGSELRRYHRLTPLGTWASTFRMKCTRQRCQLAAAIPVPRLL